MFLSIGILFVQLKTSCSPFSLTQSGNSLTSLVVYLVLFCPEGPGDGGSADPKICYIIEFLHMDCFLDKLAPWLSPGVALCWKAAACVIRLICRLYVNCCPRSKRYPLWRRIVLWWPISCNPLTKNLECHSSIAPHHQIPANLVPFCLWLLNLLGIIAFVLPEQIDVQNHATSSFYLLHSESKEHREIFGSWNPSNYVLYIQWWLCLCLMKANFKKILWHVDQSQVGKELFVGVWEHNLE
jgi:hypothetical protein